MLNDGLYAQGASKVSSSRAARSTWFFALAGVLMAAVASPVAAAQDPSVAGAAHGSQARCRYEATQVGKFGWTEALLRRIVVIPPTMYGLTRGQTVGWRFAVQRSIDSAGWERTYRSPIQRTTAGPNRPASFTKMGVGVGLPGIPPGADWDLNDVHYRVVLKMFWFRSDGSVQQRVTHGFSSHRHYVDGEYHYGEQYCAGEIRQFFDGPGA